jgi:hypothetical protein
VWQQLDHQRSDGHDHQGRIRGQGQQGLCQRRKAQEAEINAYIKKNGLEKQKPTKAQNVEIVETVLAPNIQSQIDGVKALGAPSGEEQQVNSALELSQQTLEKIEANPELA